VKHYSGQLADAILNGNQPYTQLPWSGSPRVRLGAKMFQSIDLTQDPASFRSLDVVQGATG